jgi:selenide,water dikinase
MSELNRASGEVFASRSLRVHALTDVTGFGLLGHLLEMAEGARLRARIELERIPFIEGVPALAEKDVIPSGSRANLEWVQSKVRFARGMPEPAKALLADAQTNGGLLASLPRSQASRALAALRRAGAAGVVIGEFRRGTAGIDVS